MAWQRRTNEDTIVRTAWRYTLAHRLRGLARQPPSDGAILPPHRTSKADHITPMDSKERGFQLSANPSSNEGVARISSIGMDS
jgi:hypothetical protein